MARVNLRTALRSIHKTFMTDALERIERAVADIESAGAFLRGNYFEAHVARAVRQAVLESQSPYVDRAGAAARWRCSESEIDRAAKAGVLTQFKRNGTPLFLKDEGDKAIITGTWNKTPKTKNQTSNT